MGIINLLMYIWFVAVGILILFMIGEAIADIRPHTSFTKWWRKHISTIGED